MNLNGVIGDARKRLEQADVIENGVVEDCFCDGGSVSHVHIWTDRGGPLLTFDLHPECGLCGRRDYHTHVGPEDCTHQLFSVPRD